MRISYGVRQLRDFLAVIQLISQASLDAQHKKLWVMLDICLLSPNSYFDAAPVPVLEE